MIEYKVIEMPKNNQYCEELINSYASKGWELVQVTQYQIFMKRKVKKHEQHLLQD